MRLRTSKRTEGFSITVFGVTVTVVPLSSSETARLQAKHTKINRGAESFDSNAYSQEFFNRVVKSWGSDVKDEDGNPLECNSETKLKVYEHNNSFAAAVFSEIKAAELERLSGEEGNLQPGQSGTSPKGK